MCQIVRETSDSLYVRPRLFLDQELLGRHYHVVGIGRRYRPGCLDCGGFAVGTKATGFLGWCLKEGSDGGQNSVLSLDAQGLERTDYRLKSFELDGLVSRRQIS